MCWSAGRSSEHRLFLSAGTVIFGFCWCTHVPQGFLTFIDTHTHTQREREPLICCCTCSCMYSIIGWFSYVLSPEIKLVALAYGHNILTSRPGPHGDLSHCLQSSQSDGVKEKGRHDPEVTHNASAPVSLTRTLSCSRVSWRGRPGMLPSFWIAGCPAKNLGYRYLE